MGKKKERRCSSSSSSFSSSSDSSDSSSGNKRKLKKKEQKYYKKFGFRPCPSHSSGYDISCPHCHHHNSSPPGYFPPGPGGGGYFPPGAPSTFPPPPSTFPSPPASFPPNPGFSPSAPPPFQPPAFQPPAFQPPAIQPQAHPSYYPSYPYYWLDAFSSGGLPPQAVEGGFDTDGHRIYVGRAFHEGDWLIAKVIPGKRAAYVSYNGQEISKDRFQILCGTGFYWQAESNGRIPPKAVQGGRTSSGEPLYVGRAHQSGSLTVGKIHPSHGVCYVPYDGSEHSHHHYEVLISPQ